jgi:hypothetical protein
VAWREELLEALGRQVGRRKVGILHPATEMRHLTQLDDDRQRRVAGLLQPRPVRDNEGLQRPFHNAVAWREEGQPEGRP